MRLSHSVTSALIFSAVYEVRSLSMERVKARISTNVTTLFYTLGMFIDVVTTSAPLYQARLRRSWLTRHRVS